MEKVVNYYAVGIKNLNDTFHVKATSYSYNFLNMLEFVSSDKVILAVPIDNVSFFSIISEEEFNKK